MTVKKPTITPKQKRVIDCFDGDYINTAKNAKVTHAYVRRLCTDIKYSHIREAIQKRNRKKSSEIGRKIASREERQAFWTRVLLAEERDGEDPPKMSDRLKASELLGRSEADFTDIQRQTGPDGKALRWKIEIVDPEGRE